MEGSFEDRWPSRRRRLVDLNADEPDEGEFVPGYHYHPGMKSEKKYYDNRDSSSDSDETISDSVPANYGDASPSCAAANNNGAASSSPAPAAAAAVLACPFCWKEFRSHKAVCGHMKVHREQQGIKKDREVKHNVNVAAVGRRWAATGNRGCSGSRGRAASTNAGTDQSMALVVAAESKIVWQPKPLAFAAPNPSSVPMATAAPRMPSVPAASAMANESSESSSPKPVHKDAMETVVGRAANPPMEVAVHLHASPPPAAPVHQQLVAPPPGDRRSPKGYTCKKCGMWFRTHQGLGGHMVGHKNRELAPAAVQDGAVPYRSNGKPEKVHVCKVCAAEFPGGVQLGGHMRKPWAGPPINKKPRFAVQPHPAPPRTTAVGVADLTLALPVNKADEALPAPRPAVAGRVLLFGIDIGPTGVQTPAAQQG